jgi:hypothetical protein
MKVSVERSSIEALGPWEEPVARDHVGGRHDEGPPFDLDPPSVRGKRVPFELDRPLPLETVELVAHFYPRTGAGELVLWHYRQDVEDPVIQQISRAPLAPFTCDLEVTTFAATWIRLVAKVTDWPSLITMAHRFRTTADRARGIDPRR